MANIVVITHRYDSVIYKKTPESRLSSSYMAGPVIVELARRGHSVILVKGVPEKVPAADIAILHVDLTVVPAPYLELCRTFPICLNGKVDDISKRSVTDALVTMDAPWEGRVIVKTNLNCCGKPEIAVNRMSRAENLAEPYPEIGRPFEYVVFNHVSEVPVEVWRSEHFVVQKFLPERTEQGFGIRFWTFLGNVERCDRCISTTEMVKAASTIGFEPSPVPDSLRVLRKRLGLDYGKIDFVIHDGEAVVLDVNKTVGAPPSRPGSDWHVRYANGVEDYLRGEVTGL